MKLTDEAVALLNSRLEKIWRETGNEGRLTRPARAALLEVSIGTSDRIFRQEGNDRSVLTQAFSIAGIAWDESYCQPNEPRTAMVADPEESDIGPEEPSTTAPTTGKRSVTVSIVAATLFMVAVVSIAQLRSPYIARQRTLVNKTINEARLAYSEGNLDSASRLARQALDISKEASFADAMADGLRIEGDVLAAEGHLEEAVRRYRAALPLWTTFENQHGHYSLLEVLGVAEARLGWYDDAEKHLEQSLRGLRELGDTGGVAGVCRALGSIAALRGDTDQASHWYDVAESTLGNPKNDPMMTDLTALRALLLRDEGKHAEALQMLRSCLADWRKRGHKRWTATTLFQIATVHHAAGDRVAMQAALQEAQSLFEAAGDRLGAESCLRPLDGRNRAEDLF